MKETNKQLADQLKQLQEHIKDADLQIDLANEIKTAARSQLNGKEIDDVVSAFLILAMEAKMQELKDVNNPGAIESLGDLMKAIAAHTFNMLCGSLLINAIVSSTEKTKSHD